MRESPRTPVPPDAIPFEKAGHSVVRVADKEECELARGRKNAYIGRQAANRAGTRGAPERLRSSSRMAGYSLTKDRVNGLVPLLGLADVPLWRPPTAGRHPARSGGHPDDSCARGARPPREKPRSQA